MEMEMEIEMGDLFCSGLDWTDWGGANRQSCRVVLTPGFCAQSVCVCSMPLCLCLCLCLSFSALLSALLCSALFYSTNYILLSVLRPDLAKPCGPTPPSTHSPSHAYTQPPITIMQHFPSQPLPLVAWRFLSSQALSALEP